MYEQFFNLRERPFELTPTPRFLVLTATHREALSNLQYGIAARKGVTLLVGEAGTGKTTLIRTAIEQQSVKVHCVQLHNPALTRNEFVEMLAAKFGLSDAARQSKATLLLELERLLLARRAAGETTVLIVDEAQSLPLELLEEIRLLANLETDEQKLLTVIIAGQPELSVRLNDDSLRQLKQRVVLRCELRLLSLEETAIYIAGRIRAAGGATAQIFTRDAVIALHQQSRGIPRLINVLADNALLTAFALRENPVSRQTVVEVGKDFQLLHHTGAEINANESLSTPALERRQEPAIDTAPAVAPSAVAAPGAAAVLRNSATDERRNGAGSADVKTSVATVVAMPPTEAPKVATREATSDPADAQNSAGAQASHAVEAPTMFATLGTKRRRFFFRTGS